MTKDELRGLWKAKEHASAIYQAYAGVDISGMTSDQAFEFDLQHRRAKHAMTSAEDAYSRAAKEFQKCS